MAEYKFSCTLKRQESAEEAMVEIGAEGLSVSLAGQSFPIDYADLSDFRLRNYHLFLETTNGCIEISGLGYQTEDFFEKLWLAYDARSRESLFLCNALELESEGDYAYTEAEGSRKSKAKIALYPDSLCILPHDDGARRVPLCFACQMQQKDYTLSLSLDTGETYQISRMGRDTLFFFERLADCRKETIENWQKAHKRLANTLPERLGERKPYYEFLAAQKVRMIHGLFSPKEEGFWFSALGKDRAAVELVIGGAAATYLYRFDQTDECFERRLRHAMEAVNTNRELIYTEEAALADKPLFRMAIVRSAHVRFLRQCNAGRAIHNAQWGTQLAEFFR